MSSRRIWKVAVVVAALALTGCSDWLLPGFGAGHTRYNPAESSLTVDNVDELQQAWSIGAGSPLVAGDRAYVMTSTDTSVGLRALDLATGATVWDRTVASNMPIPWFKSVAFSGGELWIAHIASDFTFKITAVDPATGDILRALPTGLPITSVVSDGDRAVWIDVASPEPTQPARLQVLDRLSLTPAWSYTFPGDTNQVGSSSFTPSLRDGKIFVAGAQVLYAFDSAGCGSPSCEPLWTLPLGRMSTPIAGHDGPLFVVAHGEGTVHGQPTSWSTLWALVADTGAESWSVAYSGLSSDPFSPASGGITSVAVAGGARPTSWASGRTRPTRTRTRSRPSTPMARARSGAVQSGRPTWTARWSPSPAASSTSGATAS